MKHYITKKRYKVIFEQLKYSRRLEYFQLVHYAALKIINLHEFYNDLMKLQYDDALLERRSSKKFDNKIKKRYRHFDHDDSFFRY